MRFIEHFWPKQIRISVAAETSSARHAIRQALSVLALGFLPAFMPSPAAEADSVKIGINYGWYALDKEELHGCTPRSAKVLWGGGIIEQYNDPKIRQAVRDHLAAMHRAGFETIRTFISGAYRPFGDHKEGLIGTDTGEIAPQDQENIKNFVSDIVAAGFGGIEVGYGFNLDGNIFCKRDNWGDCFNPGRTDSNWRFISSATELVSTAAKSISRRFDLTNEACPSRSMPAATVANAQRYLSTIASRFQEKFGRDWLISCPDSPNADRLKTMIELLAQSRLTPKYVEIHTYTEDANHLKDEFAATSNLARQINASVILGELRYHSDVQAKVIKEFMRSDPNNRIVEIIQWPLAHPESNCPIDTEPPYNPGSYDSLKRN